MSFFLPTNGSKRRASSVELIFVRQEHRSPLKLWNCLLHPVFLIFDSHCFHPFKILANTPITIAYKNFLFVAFFRLLPAK